MSRYQSIACLTWLLLMTAASADITDIRPGDPDYAMFQDDNFLDYPSSLNYQPTNPGLEDLLLLRLITALQASKDRKIFEDSIRDERNPNFILEDGSILAPRDGGVVKRFVDKTGKPIINKAPVPQTSLRSKANKKGKFSQVVCYFKLCAFRYQ